MSKSESSTSTQTTGNEPEVTTTVVETYPDYIPFSEAAKTLGVRFQQVYQRAVVRNKMRWVDAGKRKLVHKADVAAWAAIRKELGK